ncbi:hypothetical protein ACFSQT_02360 [Mesorhizobium calcicola]|uniref:Double-GTPase 1 domain-containing protein n=1 Tax=Mesorhizobium calcicola TaxID=1300310 RepID=A0ABW4W5W5_9HYPH
MNERTYILVGGPDCGKTNYIARLWESIRSKAGALVAPHPPQNVEFVEKALEFLLKGEFAPRSNRDVAESTHSFEISVRNASDPNGPLSDIVVPDVTGELWKKTLETYEIPKDWMQSLEGASGALLFVREGSEENEVALDWVTCGKFLAQRAKARAARNARNAAGDDAASDADNDGAGEGAAAPAEASKEPPARSETRGARQAQTDHPGDDEGKPIKIPTQIALCEFLRFLEFGLKRTPVGPKARVAVLVTAWDRLDKEKRVKGPMAYLRTQYPMFAGRVEDIETLDVKTFGVSVVSGDFSDPVFKAEFFEKGLKNSGYVVTDDKPAEFVSDLTLPVSWVMTS